jgi:hypothetical protein
MEKNTVILSALAHVVALRHRTVRLAHPPPSAVHATNARRSSCTMATTKTSMTRDLMAIDDAKE